MHPFCSSLNIPTWCKELERVPDKDFILDSICTDFKLLSQDSLLQAAEMHSYHSTVNVGTTSEVEIIIKSEISEGTF